MAQENIQSVLQEDRVFPPPAQFVRNSTMTAEHLESLYSRAAQDYVGFWADFARSEISWHRPFTVPLDDSRAPNYRWFTDGEMNVSYNCLDATSPAAPTSWRSSSRASRATCATSRTASCTREVSRFANTLKAQSIHRGDRVIIYMPMIPRR